MLRGRIIVVRVVQPFGNHFEDLDIGLARVIKARRINKTDVRISDPWEGNPDDRNLVGFGL